MKIAVLGAGGVGGYFGARLAQSGADVTFIARGAHGAAIRETGLKVFSPNGDVLVQPAKATDDPARLGPVDAVMFCVKLWDVESAAAACRPLVGPDTAVISFQNGVDAEERIAGILGAQHAVGGVAAIAALIEAPGVIRHTGTMAWLKYGELDGRASPRIEAFDAACRAAGIEASISPDITAEIWRKFAFLAPMAGATAATRMSIGPILADPDTRQLFTDLIAETVAVGRARGARLEDSLEAKQLAFAEGLPAEMKASMLGDLERGNRLELPWLTGAVVRLGKELGVPTPVSALIHAVLKLHAEGRN
ncbi:MAG: 2-dehydropantoate 2-reductase [Rhodospirillales bacterium]|nr:MAG: 2-dehydropantoate 2-reductase [Rhodospirillales bacterium]